MKRIGAFAAALCLIFCLAVSALAEGVDFTIELPEDFVQQSETEYINTNNYINGNQLTVVARLLQMPRTDDWDDPYSEEGLEQIALALPDESFGDMEFSKLAKDPELVTVGEEAYQAVLLRYYCLQGSQVLFVVDYRMYSEDMVYIVRLIGEPVHVYVASGGNYAGGRITFADGISVPAPKPEETEPAVIVAETPEPEQEDTPVTTPSATRRGFSFNSGLGRTIGAAIIAAVLAGFSSLFSYRKFRSLLKKCESSQYDLDAFEYKGKYYNRSRFIALRSEAWEQVSKANLEKAIQKQARKANTPLEKAELAAMQEAYRKK